MADALDGDFSCSRAVLIGTWDYTELAAVPAARNSLERFETMLTGPLGQWPTDRVVKFANRRKRGDLAHRLVQTFREATDVALFYYVGHGQYDNEDRLCLALRDSSRDARLRTTTSLTFDDVRLAFSRSPATIKIAILDCCFAELAAGRDGHLGEVVVPRLPGSYLMMASGEFATAWFESSHENPRPQTYFTKYFLDVVDRGIPAGPPGLPLGPIYDQAADALARDRKPIPRHEIYNNAADFILARNAAESESPTVADNLAAASDLLPSREASRRSSSASRPEWLWRLAFGLSVLVVLIVVVILLALRYVGTGGHSTASSPASPDLSIKGSQSTLPFTGLEGPTGVAVDGSGDVFVVDTGNKQVLRLTAGAVAPTALAFDGLSAPDALAVDAAGDVYLSDTGNNRVLRLAAGASAPITLPFNGLSAPGAVAVDAAGDVYLSDTGNERVLRLGAGSSAQTTLLFSGVVPGLAVTDSGEVYLSDPANQRVLKFTAGSSAPITLPFSGLTNPGALAVDAAGDVYLADLPSPVSRLAAGSTAPATLPFTGLNLASGSGVAVNAAGTSVYVTDRLHGRVLLLTMKS